MEHKKRITSSKKPASQEQKKKRLEQKTEEYQHPEWDSAFCWGGFMIAQKERGNSEKTLVFYRNFFRKYCAFLEASSHCLPQQMPIEHLTDDANQMAFMVWLERDNLGTQTINAYLRALRAWGNWCEKEGYIDGFECPIKEVEPPIKQVYTEKELEAMLKKPPIEKFADFRTYAIISLILSTGARSNTILNIKLEDLDLEGGYVNFNTTKAHKTITLGLERKTKKDLQEWVNYWRYGKDAVATDYLFCNEYGEQLSRAGLTKSFANYYGKGIRKQAPQEVELSGHL